MSRDDRQLAWAFLMFGIALKALAVHWRPWGDLIITVVLILGVVALIRDIRGERRHRRGFVEPGEFVVRTTVVRRLGRW